MKARYKARKEIDAKIIYMLGDELRKVRGKIFDNKYIINKASAENAVLKKKISEIQQMIYNL